MLLLAGRVLYVIVGLISSITEKHKQMRLVSAYNGICKPPLDRKSKYFMFSVSPKSKSDQLCPVLFKVARRHDQK